MNRGWKLIEGTSREEVLAWARNVTWQAGCYAFLGDGRVVYVGATASIFARIRGHLFGCQMHEDHVQTPWGCFRNLTIKFRAIMEKGEECRLFREARLIRRLTPSGNVKGNPSYQPLYEIRHDAGRPFYFRHAGRPPCQFDPNAIKLVTRPPLILKTSP